jgi:ABC-2 type transport system ATP-binding protein
MFFLIELNGVYKKTGASYALMNITFKIAEGEAAAIIGRKASGKTALADIISGCRYATHGRVAINGFDMQKRPIEAKRAVGYLPQQSGLYPEMTVDEYMRFVCSLRNVPGKEARLHAADRLERAGAAGLSGQLIRNLSGGEQQRAALAGALCGEPKALILDEPAAGLDPDESDALRETITSLKGHYTIVLMTRSIREAADICGSVLILSRGAIAAQETTENLKKAVGSSRRLKVRLKTDRQKGLELLRGIEGIEYAEAAGSSESGTCDFTVESVKDIREYIFGAAAGARIALLGMSGVKLTLDDIFSELAGGEETGNESRIP